MSRPLRPTLALIAAFDRRRAVGRGGGLLWHESEDQKHFHRVTIGCRVIMGRVTWDSLPKRFLPAPGRRNRHATAAVACDECPRDQMRTQTMSPAKQSDLQTQLDAK